MTHISCFTIKTTPEVSPASIKDHKQILECIRARDVQAAQRCMAEHLQHAKARLILDIENQSPVKRLLVVLNELFKKIIAVKSVLT